MKNNLTEMVFILDRSGSMYGLEADTVGGFNSMIKKQKKEDGKAFVSTILFNDRSCVLHDRVDLEEIQEMKTADFEVGGCTALYDAVGQAIHHIENIHKYARKEDVPENTIFVITTDGLENASHIYNNQRIRALIEKKKEKDGWQFLFIAANIDAEETAASFGIERENAVNYCADDAGTQILYKSVGRAISNLRTNATVGSSWREDIDIDYNKRHNKR